MKNFILLILVSFAFGLSLGRNYKLSKQINAYKIQNDSLSHMYDSLSTEIFVKDIDLGRYELIMERMRDVDSSFVEKSLKDLE
jgi:hypothetical protein